MKTRKIGIDVGGVIMANHNKSEDTSFFGANYLQSEAEEGAFEGIKTLIDYYGAENVFIVSKCGTNTQRKTMEWLGYLDFYDATGFRIENIYFCKKRKDKALICKNLEITDFVDDRLEVLSYMNSVDNVYLFNPQLEEMNQFSEACGHYTVVWNWEELMSVFNAEWRRDFRGALGTNDGTFPNDLKVTDTVDMYDACIPKEKVSFEWIDCRYIREDNEEK